MSYTQQIARMFFEALRDALIFVEPSRLNVIVPLDEVRFIVHDIPNLERFVSLVTDPRVCDYGISTENVAQTLCQEYTDWIRLYALGFSQHDETVGLLIGAAFLKIIEAAHSFRVNIGDVHQYFGRIVFDRMVEVIETEPPEGYLKFPTGFDKKFFDESVEEGDFVFD